MTDFSMVMIGLAVMWTGWIVGDAVKAVANAYEHRTSRLCEMHDAREARLRKD